MECSALPGRQGLCKQAALSVLPAADPGSAFFSHGPDLGSPAVCPWLDAISQPACLPADISL